MAITYEVLAEKRKYIEDATKTITRNLAVADIEGKKRHEMKSFPEYLKNSRHSVIETKDTIRRDFEMMDMVKNEVEHEGVIFLMKMYHKLLKTASARNV
jgi:flagellar basal body rod protein FlgB